MSRQAASARPAQSAPVAPARLPAASEMAMSLTTAPGTEQKPSAAPPQPLPLPVAKGRPDEPPPVDFSHVANRGPKILDADTERARITRLLLTELAPALGLDLSRLRITVDAAGGARIDARGANGLQEDSQLLLHPSRYRPDSSRGRYLLAHEAVHAAQRQLPSQVEGDAHVQVAAAEVEAGELGRDFAARRPLRRPRIAVRRLEALADSGEPAARETAPVPALVDSVKDSRSREIALIHDALDGWWVSDGDVFAVMRVLDSMDFEVARAVLLALEDSRERYWLADNINPPHVYRHRRSVLVAYAALDQKKFDAIDLKVLRALPMSGMSPQETEAAVRTVRCLSASDIESLLASEKGDAIARLIGSPALDPKRREEIQLAEKNAAKDEAALAAKRRKILQLGQDDEVQAVVRAVRKQLSVPDDAHGQPRHPHGGDAIAVAELLDRHSGDETRFLAIAELLESEGLIDALLELMPAGKFFDPDHPEHGRTLIRLVRSRLAIKNEQMIEELLSYRFLDWAIRDYEAQFAYELIRLMPMSAQYRFRQRDGGKWYLRLLDNLPDAGSRPGLEIRKAQTAEERDRMVAAGATRDPAAGDEDLYYNASAMYEARLRDKGVRAELDALIADFEAADKGIFRDHEAIALYRKVVALGGASLEPGKEDAGDAIKREALVRELDRHGLIARLFDQLPNDFLFAEENRISTVKIMLWRDSIHAQQHARDLVSYGLFDWMIRDSEAYLAYLCIKSLPGEEREAFVDANADLWRRIQGEMSVSMRHKRDTNLYIGDKEGTDRAAVLAQLADANLWTADNSTMLDSLLRMAVAMTEHRFAFERSREFAAVDNEALTPLVAKYRLWDPAGGRDTYSPEMLKGTRWHEEGIFASLKSLWGGLVTLWNMDVLFIDGKIGARVDLNDAQDFMGGDLMGARLADPARAGSRQEPVSKDANKLTLLLDPAWLDGGGAGKSAELILPQLLIESTNVQTANTTIQTGKVDLRNLHIRAAYDDQNTGQAAQAHVTLDSLIVNDLLIARSSTMYTMTRLVVETLRLAAGTIDSTTGAPKGMRTGRYIPFPLLALAMLPWLAQIAVTQLIAMPIRRLGKLPDQGLEPEGRFQPDMLSRTKSIDVSFSKLSAEGFSTSGGQHVAHAAVEDFTLRVGLNKATRLRAELASVDDRLTALDDGPGNDEVRARLQARRATLLASQKDVEAHEQRYLAIGQQIRAGGLDGVRQRELQQQLDDLDFEDSGAAFLDVGRVEASGISGAVTARDRIELRNVHGEGGSSALLGMVSGPTVTPAELARRANEGVRAPPLFSNERSGAFSLGLGDISTGHLEVGGGVRGTKQIEQELEDLGDIAGRPELAPLADSLRVLHGKARRYEAMVAYGVSALDPAQLDEFRELRRVLTADAAVIVESIKLTRAQLDVDLASDRVDLGADKLQVAGLKLPKNGIEVEEIVATGLRAGGMPKNGLLDWKRWRETLTDADAKIDSLEITRARSRYHGLLFEKASLTGAYAGMKERGNLVEAGLAQLNVQGLGLVPRLGLMNQRLAGLREKLRVSADTDKPAIQEEIDKLATHLSELQDLADRRMLAYLRLAQAKTPDEIEKAKAAMVEIDGTIAVGLAQYGAAEFNVDRFGVKITGAGDVLSDALGGGIDPMGVLSRGGVRIVGTGPDKRLFERIALKQAQGAVEGPGKSLTGDVADFEIGETRLDLGARKEGDSLFVDFPTFDVDSLTVNQLLLTSSPLEGPGWQVWSYGASGIGKFSVSGSVRLDSRVEGSQDLSDYRLAHVHIDSFKVGSIHGNGLGLSLPEKKLELEIVSGSINDITGTDVDVEFPADPKGETLITGKAGIKSIDKLVIGRAVWDTWAVDHGRIDARNIGISTVRDGGIEVGIGDLDLSDFALRGPDGWVRLTLKDLGARATWRDGALDIDDIHFGSLDVSGVHWKVGESGYVESDKRTTITGLRLKGRIRTEQTAAGKDGKSAGEKERKLSGIHIETLDIDKIESERLVYQDEDSRIELGRADPAKQKKMLGFEPLFLQNLKVWGLDWKPGGVTAGKFELGSYEANAHYHDLKSSLAAGLALRGTGMSGEVVGPGAYTLDVGKVESTGGELHSDTIDTKFGSGAIVGKVAMGPDYVEAHDVVIDQTQLSSIRYRDLPRIVELDTVNVGTIKLGKVRQNYAISTAAATKGEKSPTTMEVRDLELFDVLALRFRYHGEAEAKVVKEGVEQTETTTQDIHGDSATISHLHVSAFDRNAIDNTASLSATVDTAPGAKAGTKPFGVKGLVADLASTIGSETSRKKLTTDLDGGPITANGIRFKTVVLGEVGTGADKKDVTRTGIDGEFELTRLGFINPDLTITDSRGRTRIHSSDGTSGSLEINGIKPRFLPNGTVSLPITSVIGKGLEVNKGDMTVRLPLLEIKDIAVGLRGMGTDEGIEMLATKIGSIHVEGMRIEIVKHHKAKMTDEEYAKARQDFKDSQEEAKKNPAGTFIAEPLAKLQGSADGEVDVVIPLPLTDRHLEWEDPDITPVIKDGVVEFDGMTNYSVQLHTVDDGNGGKKDVIELGNGVSVLDLHDFKRKMPGFYGDAGSWWYGKINLKEMVEGMMNEPGSEPSQTYEAASGLRDFYGFTGNFALGDGRMGWDRDGDGKLGTGDNWIDLQRVDDKQNRIEMTESNLGDQINLNMPEFHAAGAAFDAGRTQDGTARSGSVGDIKLETIDIRIKGLADMTLTITLEIKDGTILDVYIGDLTFADAAGLATLKAPTLTQVDPKGRPKAGPTGGTP